MTPHPASESARAEMAFRAIAFHTAYDITFSRVHDRTERFAKAIDLSAQPIAAECWPKLLKWYRGRRKHQSRR